MDVKQAEGIAGKLTNTSKMPGFSYGIPAKYCQTGGKLREQEGSPCSKCYAFRGFYPMPNVRDAMEKRFQSLGDKKWVEAMITMIEHRCKKVPFFRWHDSGDIQSVSHLNKIIKVAKALPHIKFWLPTQERRLLAGISPDKIPDNLVVRVSNTRIGEHVEDARGYNTSGVSPMDTDGWKEIVGNNTKRYFGCPSSLQDNECKTCRACWNPAVKHVVYRAH